MYTPLYEYPSFSPETVSVLRDAFERAERGELSRTVLRDALVTMCGESHERGYPPERVVITLRDAWQGIRRPLHRDPAEWHRLYMRVVEECLTIYYDGSSYP
jgi:hypothetical protein